jgi:hypothetical protein
MAVAERQAPDLAEEMWASGVGQEMGRQGMIDIAMMAGGQARGRVERTLVVGLGVYSAGGVEKGMAETIESDQSERTFHADGSPDDLGQSIFCSIPTSRCQQIQFGGILANVINLTGIR